jgi:hypothetical protein
MFTQMGNKDKWSNLRGFGRMKNEVIKSYTGIRVEGQPKISERNVRRAGSDQKFETALLTKGHSPCHSPKLNLKIHTKEKTR